MDAIAADVERLVASGCKEVTLLGQTVNAYGMVEDGGHARSGNVRWRSAALFAVIGMIGRLDPQKGFDLLADAAPTLLKRGVRLVVQGSGHPSLADPFRAIASQRPDRVAFIERFDRVMARKIYAGADFFAMPSRFEPCGQGQMIALRYGTPPIVHRTGGLADTVIDQSTRREAGTGFVFDRPTVAALLSACDAAIALRDAGGSAWDGLLDRAMAVDFDWVSGSGPRYVEAYRRAVEIRRG